MAEFTDELRKPVMLHANAEQTNAERRRAADEIERLESRLRLAEGQIDVLEKSHADLGKRLSARPASAGVGDLLKALSAAKGYLMSAAIDLETGARKKTALDTIKGGIKVISDALEHYGEFDARAGSKPEGDGWQPIETAPKDGTEVLIWYEAASGRRTTAAHFCDLSLTRGTWKTSTVWVDDPAGWRPLLAPPQSDATTAAVGATK